MINVKMQPQEVQKLSPKIIVIGVGGAGGNAVNNMISSNLEGCQFLVCNTDAQALDNSLSDHKVQLGQAVTGGLGAGSKPEVGKAAAEESLDEVLQYIDGTNMAFITAGMGGGSGTGGAPVIAKACRERGILTVGVVTKPFHFEGAHRMKSAEAGIKEMQGYVDTLIVIPNQNLFRIANEKTTFAEAFRMADSVLQSGVRGVTDLMVRPGLVNLDFADIRTAMLEMGKAMMGTGEASGEKRAIEAAEAAINNPLLDDVSMKGAHGVIINVTGGYDMTLFEADEACNRIRDEVDPDANIIFGATFDEGLEGVMRVSIVATGIEKESAQKNRPLSGSGASDSSSSGGATLERATPTTAAAESETGSPVSAPIVPASKPYTTGAGSIRGITAPSGVPATTKMAEPEADLFEQGQFEPAGESVGAGENAMRGERYGGAFIPPKPMEPEKSAPETQAAMPMHTAQPTQATQAMQPAQSTQAAPMAPGMQPASGLNLNPPKMPAPQSHGRSPSFFERITGSVQQKLDELKDESHAAPSQHHRTAPTPGPVTSGPIASGGAAQGSLKIDAPAAAPQGKAEDELDIPAFLRRQAN